MSRLPRASVVVLAGGRSSRFGRDKLAEPLGGRPLLEHAVRAAATVSREVLVVGRTGLRGMGGGLPDVPGVDVRGVLDAQPYAGPLVALETALGLVRERLAVIVAGDMPLLAPAVLRALLDALDGDRGADGASAAALVFRGRRQPLPVAVRVEPAAAAARRAIAAGERSLGGWLASLAVRDLPEVDWRRLDATAASLRDVDTPDDLRGL